MRYELNFDDDKIIDIEAIGDDGVLDLNDCCKIMNEQQEQISYWKHKVSSLLWILSQFDEEKVKELLKELEDE